ncbi:acyltransferase [Aerococcus agrisoli]|uniref:Acyltransferase n=1 Tax=Aerococcus agrisoli TaxID=2487350 RepID=A0A3N4GDD4_9LACT|nr:acyltransferase [Aerococcus agrisoli]RPA60792.1 acyltransferase [Aerococcus agrisoli]
MKERQQNFELLRIIAMFLIVVSHVITHNVMAKHLELSSVNTFLLSLLRSFIYICVNVYIIITGYFSINAKQLKFRKVLNVILLPGFISAILLITLMAFGAINFDIWRIIGKLFATFRGEYWFISNYFALYLFIPLLNKIIHSFSRKELQQWIFLTTLVGVIWPFFIETEQIIAFNSGFSLIFFMYLYFVGAHIRLYGSFVKDLSKEQYLGIYVGLGLITGILQFLFPQIDFLNYNGPFEIIMSYAFFMFISKITVKSTKINYIAMYTLSVYLVHEQGQMRELIWNLPIVDTLIQLSPITFIPAVLLVAVLVFCGSWIIGWTLTKIFENLEKLIYKFVDRNVLVEKLKTSSK